MDKIITVDAFNYPEWTIEEDVNPYKLELFQLIADVIANDDPDLWKPKTPRNNHWRDRENGGL